jgi:hypothetical protein
MAWGIRTTRQVGGYLEVLYSSANADLKQSIVLDATAVAADVNGDRKLAAGTLLSKNATSGQYERFTAAVGQVIVGVLATDEVFPTNDARSDRDSQMWCHGQQFRADRIVDWVTHGTAAKAALPTCQFK